MKSLAVRLRAERLGGHTHVDVFAGPDADHRASCGSLVFRNEEWDVVLRGLARVPGLVLGVDVDSVSRASLVLEVPA